MSFPIVPRDYSLCFVSGDAKMTDKLEIQSQEDNNLKRQLERIEWPIEYGKIKIQLRSGRPTLVTIERTVKLD